MRYTFATTIATTIVQAYLLFTYSDKKITINLKCLLAIIGVMFIKPYVMLLLEDNLLTFIFVWMCNFIIAYYCIGNNFKQNLELSFFVEMITLISYYMSSGILLVFDRSINVNDIFNFNILFYSTKIYFILVYLILMTAFGIFRKFIPLSFQESKIKTRSFSGIYIIMAINIFIKIINDINIVYGFKMILFVFINLFILDFYIMNNQLIIENIKDELELNEKEKRINELTLYIGTIEELAEKYREFKHDYKNIVLGIGSDNINENTLLNKLNNEITLDKNYDAFLNLRDIHYIPLKSILSYYIMLSRKKSVEVSLITVGEVTNGYISDVEFSRVMGIILENALEEASENDYKKIEIYVEALENCLNLTVANTFKENKVKLDEIYKRGFSTKGENRGLGLHILKSIVEGNTNMTLNTFVNEGMFTQDIYIQAVKES